MESEQDALHSKKESINAVELEAGDSGGGGGWFFIYSKNQLLALFIFAMVSFVSFAFISALIFKISFLLLTLGFFISSFSSCFRCRVRLFI